MTIADASSLVSVDHEYTITYADLKANMLQNVAGNRDFLKRPRNRDVARDNVNGWGDPFYGFTKAELETWLVNGYRTEALQGLIAESPPIRKRRKLSFSDEGDLQVDLALSGFDYPFLKWDQRESVPGLAIDVEFSFQAGVKASTIIEYEKWLAKAIYSLETEGIDLEVSIFYNSSGLFLTGDDKKVRTRITVKRENETTDFSSWSVMFSPAGWRGMTFLSIMCMADSLDRDVSPGLGHGIGQSEWALAFDAETRKLTVRCPWNPQDFPAQKMSDQLREVVKTFH